MNGLSLSHWMDLTGTDVDAVAAHCGKAVGTVYRWMRGERMPEPEDLEKLERLTAGLVTASAMVRTVLDRRRQGGTVRDQVEDAKRGSAVDEAA